MILINLFTFSKDIYPYEYMNDLEKFSQTSLLEKENFFHLNMNDMTDVDHTHANLYLFWKMWLGIYELAGARFFLQPGLA